MFKTAPVYNAALESETRLINLDHIEEVKPHANVPVDPGAVDTPCCEVQYYSGVSTVVLVEFASMQSEIQALVGVIDELGNIS
jgi:hypothetical protein